MSRRKQIIDRILYDPGFRSLFTGMEDELARLAADPGCPCNSKIIDRVDHRLAGLANEGSINNEWRVIDCHISELEGLLAKHHRHGRRNFAIARDGDMVVCVLNETIEGE